MRILVVPFLLVSPVILAERPQDNRHPIPNPTEQKEIGKMLRELFKVEFAKPAADDKTALAIKLFDQAAESKDDPKTVYVLLHEAKELAVQAGNVELAFEAMRLLTKSFQADFYSIEVNSLAALERTVDSSQRPKIMNAYLLLTEAALLVDDGVLAEKILASGVSFARRVGEAQWIKQMEAKKKDIAERSVVIQKVKKAKQTLSASPDDPAANIVLGQYECFVKGNWEEGLALLVKSGDSGLKSLAEKDLSKPGDVREQVAIGDGWFSLYEKENGAFKEKLGDRANFWYEMAVPTLTGLTRSKLEKRLRALKLDKLLKGSWIEIKDPKEFGLMGKVGAPFELAASPGKVMVATLKAMPDGEFDGISLKVRPATGNFCCVFYEAPKRAFGFHEQGYCAIYETTNDARLSAVTTRALPRQSEYTLTILLAERKYRFYVDGVELMQDKTMSSFMKGLILQSNGGTTSFEEIRLRKKG